jgi:hypothetical protein
MEDVEEDDFIADNGLADCSEATVGIYYRYYS